MDLYMTNMLIATETASAGSQLITIVIMYAVIFIALWFFFIRPEKKRQKQAAKMLSELEIGDSVLTSSGFYGVVIDITDDTVIVEFGSNKNCRIPMQKSAIVESEKAQAE